MNPHTVGILKLANPPVLNPDSNGPIIIGYNDYCFETRGGNQYIGNIIAQFIALLF